MDMLRARQGRPTVLPLTAWESTKYIRPGEVGVSGERRGHWPCLSPTLTVALPGTGSLILSRRERRGYGLALVRVLRHVLLGLSLILLDYGVFWLLDLVQHQLQGEVVARGELGGLGVLSSARPLSPSPFCPAPTAAHPPCPHSTGAGQH